jgi:hypothetical protein
MLRFFYNRSGLFFVAFGGICAALIYLANVEHQSVQSRFGDIGLWIALGTMAVGTFFALIFVLKSYRSNEDHGFLRTVFTALAALAAAFSLSFVSFIFMGAFGFVPQVTELTSGVLFVLEQILAGALFDFMESFNLHLIPDDSPDPPQPLEIGIWIFLVRLLGSVVVGGLLFRAYEQLPRVRMRRQQAPPTAPSPPISLSAQARF